MVDLSEAHLQLTARLIRAHQVALGSPWRRLDLGQQALLALVYLGKGATYATLAEGLRIGLTTAWRYVREVVVLLAGQQIRNGESLSPFQAEWCS